MSDMQGLSWLRIRRGLDTAVVVAAMPLLLPVAGLALIAVVLGDRRMPVVRLGRVGRRGKPLATYKIRSMHVERGGQPITESTDVRLTRVGALLRTWRVDEIPQVISILTGTMALIGPRPEAPEFVDTSCPDWQIVLEARPGIAGLTQILAAPWELEHLTGDDPTEKYRSIALPAKVAIDAWYVTHASPRLDLLILRSLFAQFVLGKTWTDAHDLVARSIPAGRVLLAEQ